MVMGLGITPRMIWHGALVIKMTDEVATEAAEEAGRKLLKEANRNVPHELGTLEASGDVTAENQQAFVSYDTPYAVRLHEHPEYKFQGKGEGKWLEKAMQRRNLLMTADMAPPFVKFFKRDSLGRFTR
jgi:hypothetical protein